MGPNEQLSYTDNEVPGAVIGNLVRNRWFNGVLSFGKFKTGV